MSSPPPTVGRTVHFYPASPDLHGLEFYLAFVGAVRAEAAPGACDLMVCVPGAEAMLWEFAVPPGEGGPRTWRYPPRI